MWGPDDAIKNGNLRGIINSLDHIKSLGANALWMTPVFDSSTADGGEKLQATGYFTNDYFKIDPHFGTESDLRELIEEAHKRGIHVILDGVFGHHGGVTSPRPTDTKSHLNGFSATVAKAEAKVTWSIPSLSNISKTLRHITLTNTASTDGVSTRHIRHYKAATTTGMKSAKLSTRLRPREKLAENAGDSRISRRRRLGHS